MEIVVTESQPPHGDRQLVSYPDWDSNGEPFNPKQQSILDKDFGEEIESVLVSK